MADRVNVSSGTPWEAKYGYSRAVRVGNTVHVAGTTASDEQGQVMSIGDAYGQAVYIFKKIDRALIEAGAAMSDVVRIRMFVTDIGHAEEIGRAHGEFLGEIRPVSTMIEISRLIDDRQLVEIEAEAIIASE